MRLWNRTYRRDRSWSRALRCQRDLQQVLRVERLRADRRGIPFCLITVSLCAPTDSKRHVVRAARLLKRRLRLTDVLGQFGATRIAAVLTDTPEMGGRTVAADLDSLFADAGIRVELRLEVYDPHSIGSDGGTPEDGGGIRDETIPGAAPVYQPSDHYGIAELSTLRGWQDGLKRGLDVAGAGVLLFLACPVMLLIAVLVRVTSPGPVIFRQLREGQFGRSFVIYKFRTMVDGADRLQSRLKHRSHRDGPAFKMIADPRVTRFGRWLRATCLDELPQLMNVLKGDMSLVGPRPLPIAESRGCAAWHRRRLDVRPGLTGSWQVGSRKESFDDWMRSDLRYADRGSVWTDIALLVKSVWVVLKRKGHH